MKAQILNIIFLNNLIRNYFHLINFSINDQIILIKLTVNKLGII